MVSNYWYFCEVSGCVFGNEQFVQHFLFVWQKWLVDTVQPLNLAPFQSILFQGRQQFAAIMASNYCQFLVGFLAGALDSVIRLRYPSVQSEIRTFSFGWCKCQLLKKLQQKLWAAQLLVPWHIIFEILKKKKIKFLLRFIFSLLFQNFAY